MASMTSSNKSPFLHESFSPTGDNNLKLPKIIDRENRSPTRKTMKDFSALCESFGEEHTRLANMMNPSPLPYQVKSFKPSTVTKLVDIPRRHQDSFQYPADSSMQRHKGVIIHTNRYSWTQGLRAEQKSQRERLLAEINKKEEARGKKRRREVLIHRTHHDLLLGGESIKMTGVNSAPAGEIAAPTHRDDADKDLFEENPEDYQPYDQEIFFDTSAGTASMGVQKVLLHKVRGRENSLEDQPPPPRPSRNPAKSRAPKLPQVPFPYIPSMASSTSGSEYDFMLSKPTANSHTHQVTKRPGLSQFILGGHIVPMNERADITMELRFLKSIVLPEMARDLYVGRGIRLPPNHATLKPRVPPPSVPIPVAKMTMENDDASTATKEETIQEIDPVVHDSEENSSSGPVQNTYLTQDPEEETKADPRPSKASSQSYLESIEDIPVSSMDATAPAYLSKEVFMKCNALISNPEEKLTFDQLKSFLPKGSREITEYELNYLKFFFDQSAEPGKSIKVEDFLNLLALHDKIMNLNASMQNYYENLNIDTEFEESIKKHITSFRDADIERAGKLPIDFLKTFLPNDTFTSCMDTMNWNENSVIDKLTYLALLPYLISIHEQTMKAEL